jgi:hypothetical protein
MKRRRSEKIGLTEKVILVSNAGFEIPVAMQITRAQERRLNII